MTDWSKIKSNIQSELVAITKLLEEVNIIEPHKSFELTTKDLLAPDPESLKENIGTHFSKFKKDVVYTIALKGCEDYNAINKAFENVKKSKKTDRKYSKQNNVESEILYVGSSQSKGLVSRMRNHLGVGAEKVYSMHIKEWMPQDLSCTIIIRVFEADIPHKTFKLVKMLELLEQGIWDANKPMFGKRSGLL